MTTITNRTGKTCHSCNERRPGPSQDAKHLDLCDRCLDWAEAENGHSDYAHDDPSMAADETTLATAAGCLVCKFGTWDAYKASFTRRGGSSATKAASTVDKTGTHVCPVCHRDLPVTKFPTTTPGVRSFARCRECRDHR